ncbi:hypothetical protein SAMN05421788_104264 [Filimonas lacunae]|uniref:Uncharacterized protein n=2 Tax=Filimonas lacunae TaxID=477680 RepID=A0A173MRQ8_9BACT|nr:hypothetical protein [Filimonas lacunae]BAV10365.1 hypothetical protein FLA_6427 [Filimonas lacunae]SIT16625.1 hypothetical protein SAMN05421788_104264 [Filimonas lacunae]
MIGTMLVLMLLTVVHTAKAQFITGKWYGVSPLTSSPGYHESSKEPEGDILEIAGVDSNRIHGLSYHYSWVKGKFYYVIKTLECTYNAKDNKWTIQETSIKDNHLHPAEYTCLHTYILTFSTSNQKDSLTGTWTAASADDCGAGVGKFARTKPIFTKKADADSVEAITHIITLPKDGIDVRKDLAQVVSKDKLKKEAEFQLMLSRSRTLIQSIPLQSPNIKVLIWDNNVLDGDNISLYFNKELILNRKRITAEPIELEIKAVRGQENELIMYANNLGDIPPNTAMMRVYANGKQYEVFMSSDEHSNGIIRFTME